MLAKKLSVVLSPPVWYLLVLLLIILRIKLTNLELLILIPLLLVLQLFIPISYVLRLLKLGKVESWDLPKREDRYLLLGITLINYLISFGLIYLFGNIELLKLNAILLILLLISFGITFFSKISLHLISAGSSIVIINFLFSGNLLFLYLLIPLVGWARYELKRHTQGQIISGALIGIAVTYLLLSFLY